MNDLYHSILADVSKPARYTGNELNSIIKDQSSINVSFALAFPDVYEVGMSYLGYKILYHILNKCPDVQAERVYAPWVDMEEKIREHGLKLFSHETRRPLETFDLIGFTLQYEMSYSNIVNMINLGGIAMFAEKRKLEEPFIVGGGPCVYNPEPLADFFDFFLIGEGEELIIEIVDIYRQWKMGGRPGGRAGYLRKISRIPGVYVPSFYHVSYQKDGTIEAVDPVCEEVPATINKRVINDLEKIDFPTRPVVPFAEIVHDRIMLEVFRGCSRGCRFCQAGMIYRPVRERSHKTLVRLAEELVKNTGYDEISLVSLSTADYSCLGPLIDELITTMRDKGVSVSLPSLRIDSFSIELARKVQQVRKSGLTFAPEAGTQRMRNVINKGVTEQDLEDAVSSAFRAGWSSVKLYFMIGLPTETDEDIKGIADLAYKVLDIYKTVTGRRNGKVTVSVSSFVPKGNTPFQWYGQNTKEEIERKQQYLKGLLKSKDISFNWHDARTSSLEGVFARGDRRLSKVIYAAWKKGARFDGWSEYFNFEIWMQAFAENGLDPKFYANRERTENEIFPWQHISAGVNKAFLLDEYKKALCGELTGDCRRDTCSGCGVCPGLGVEVVDWG